MDDEDRQWRDIGHNRLPEIIAPKDIPNLNVWLKYLWAELRKAQMEFASGKHLDGVYLSLVATIAFLSAFDTVGIDGLFAPLAALESALWALDEGVVEPILKPPRRARPGRSRSPDQYQKLKGATVYVVTRLCEIGLARPAAMEAVAGDLRRLGVKPDRGSGEITPRTVRGWCEEIAADIESHGAAAKQNRSLLAHPINKTIDGLRPRDAEAWLRSRLSIFGAAIGARTT